jgi:hypothetical protein
MPFIDLEPAPLSTPLGRPKEFAVTPGKDEIDKGSEAVERPSWGKGIAVSFSRGNTIVSTFADETRNAPTHDDPEFKGWDYIKDDPELAAAWDSFARLPNNRRAYELMKDKLAREKEDRKLSDAMPWWQAVPLDIAAGVLDLPTLIPGGAFVRGARGGFSIGRSALSVGAAAGVSTAAQEAYLQASQETRTWDESAVNIGASVVLGGILGAAGAKFLSPRQFSRAAEALERNMAGDVTARAHDPDIPPLVFRTEGETVTASRAAGDGVPDARYSIAKGEDGEFRVSQWAKLSGEEARFEVLGEDGLPSRGYVRPQTFKTMDEAQAWVRDVVDARLNETSIGVPSGLGAAAPQSTLADNSLLGKAAGAVAKLTSPLNPLMRALASPSTAVRDSVFQLVENSMLLKKNAVGVRSVPAVETLMKEWNAGLGKALSMTEAAWKERKKSGAPYMRRAEFREHVGRAMRRADTSDDPHVQKVAEAWRRDVFDPMKDAAIKAGLLPPDVTVQTAASYFSRMWNIAKLVDGEVEFKAIASKWVQDNLPSWRAAFDRQVERNLDNLRTEIRELETDKLRRGSDRAERQRVAEAARASAPIEETRGGGVQFHGSSRPISDFDEGHFAEGNFYGNGFYTTDALDIAHNYGKKGGKSGGERFVYQIREKTPVNMYDMEAPISPEIRAQLDGFRNELIDLALENNPQSLRELFDEVRAESADLRYSKADVNEIFDDITSNLEKLGFGGMTHKGGKLTKSPAHDVKIYFNPKRDLEVTRIDPDARRTAPAATPDIAESDLRDALRIIQAGAPKPKGVKTLTQFVHAEGGLVDFGGELRNMGITNQTLPTFVRTEGRKRGLKGGGWTFDDMAQHAWESGYFPNHTERPTVNEFLDALSDDFNKIRRVLREEDYAAFRQTELIEQLEADLQRLGINPRETPRFSTSDELKGMVGRVYDAMDARDDARIAKLRSELAAREEKYRVEADARFLGDPAELGKSVADEVFNTLTGRNGGIRPEFIKVQARGPLKERTFNIPDELIEKFLESDVELVGRRYSRVMAADIELKNQFGSLDMAEQLQKVTEDYDRLRAALPADAGKARQKLFDREKADKADIEALRDILRGTHDSVGQDGNFARIARAFNHVNYIRSMGEVVLSSITDPVRIAMVVGLREYMSGTRQLMTNLKAIKASVAETRLAGNALERVSGGALATITDIMDPHSTRGPIEAFLENMTNVASKWNGIRLWTDMNKAWASVLIQNRIIKNALDFDNLKPKEKTYMHYLGIDRDMAQRIKTEFSGREAGLTGLADPESTARTEALLARSGGERPTGAISRGGHGENIDGVHVANTEKWSDREAVRTFRAALNKDLDSIIVTKSVADVPLFATTPAGRMLLQFKSFALASHQKVLIRGLQEDGSRFVGGLVAMTATGMLLTYLKAISGNRPEVQEKALTNPGWWIGEGLDRSGILSVPMELANGFEKGVGFNPIKSPLKAFDPEGSISQKNQNRNIAGALLGPSVGLVEDVRTVATIPGTLSEGADVTKGQKGAAERVLPFNSYYGLRQMIRYLFNPPE